MSLAKNARNFLTCVIMVTDVFPTSYQDEERIAPFRVLWSLVPHSPFSRCRFLLDCALRSSQSLGFGVNSSDPDMASDPIKILIVDDDERVLIELERLLESEGYSTATAWGGREALALSEKKMFRSVSGR